MKKTTKIALLASILSFAGQSMSAEAGDKCDPNNTEPNISLTEDSNLVYIEFDACLNVLSSVVPRVTTVKDIDTSIHFTYENISLDSHTVYGISKGKELLFTKKEFPNYGNKEHPLTITAEITGAITKKFSFNDKIVKEGQKTTVSDITGAWYDPKLSGLGFNFVQAPNGLFAYYYGYDKNGDRLWLLSDVIKTDLTKNQVIKLKMNKGADNNGANFTTKPVTGSGVASWGEMELNISSCTNATAKLTGDDGTVTFNLEKLANANAITCYD